MASITVSKRFRFSFAAGGAITINNTRIGSFLSLAVGTNAYPLIDRFRIRRVELFGPMTTQLVPVTVKLEFTASPTNAFDSSTKLYSDTSMSSVSAAHLSVKPEEESIASKWVRVDSSSPLTLFIATLPANGIMDISMDVVLNDGSTPPNPVGITSTPTSGTIGTVPPPGAVSLGLQSF